MGPPILICILVLRILGDLRQDQPIINGDQPFDSDFDSSMVYGPIFGRMWYTGMRYKFE